MIVCDGSSGFTDVVLCQAQSILSSFAIIVGIVALIGIVSCILIAVEIVYLHFKRKKR